MRRTRVMRDRMLDVVLISLNRVPVISRLEERIVNVKGMRENSRRPVVSLHDGSEPLSSHMNEATNAQMVHTNILNGTKREVTIITGLTNRLSNHT